MIFTRWPNPPLSGYGNFWGCPLASAMPLNLFKGLWTVSFMIYPLFSSILMMSSLLVPALMSTSSTSGQSLTGLLPMTSLSTLKNVSLGKSSSTSSVIWLAHRPFLPFLRKSVLFMTFLAWSHLVICGLCSSSSTSPHLPSFLLLSSNIQAIWILLQTTSQEVLLPSCLLWC